MDFAELGIKVDTNDLDLTVQQLKKLQPAAAGAAAATDKLSRAVEGMSSRAAKASVTAAKSALTEAKASKDKLIAAGNATKADIKAADAAVKKAQADLSAAKAAQARSKATMAQIELEQQATRVTNAATLAMKKQDAALAGIAGRVGGRGGGGNMPTPANDLMPNRFNTANIAAQFQDIGVTAAMGMNPLTIALQQGTQLSAILNTMENPLKGIAVAFRSILNPVSLLSIAMVGLIAAGAQMVDWVSVGQGLLNGLAGAIEASTDALVTFTPLIVLAGAGFVAWNLPTIYSQIVLLTQGVWNLTKSLALLAVANPFAAMVIAAAAALTAMYLFRDELTKILGFDIFEAAKKGVDAIIGSFVGMGYAAVEIFKSIPDVVGYYMVEAANAALRVVYGMVNGTADLINKILPENLEISNVLTKQLDNNFTAGASLAGIRAGEAFGRGFEVGSGVTDRVTMAVEQGSQAAVDKLRELAAAMGQSDEKSKKGAKSQAELYDELVGKTKQRIESLKIEQRAIFMTAQAAAQLRYQTELLNDAKNKGIDLTAAQTSELMQYASEMSAIEERTRQLNEAYNLVRDTGKGFFQDMKNGLREGKSAWESFSDAVTNALNRITDKFFEASLDMVFDNIGSSSSGGGNFISTIADMLFNAKGNAFTSSGVEKFANGGAFTNSVVTSPTMFAFANGGKFGVMGEAGAEAVMPLRRGSDGSLGVQVVGGAGGSPVVVNVINNSGAQARTEQRQTANGQEIDVFIDDVVASKIGSQGTSSNRALQESNNRQLIRRR